MLGIYDATNDNGTKDVTKDATRDVSKDCMKSYTKIAQQLQKISSCKSPFYTIYQCIVRSCKNMKRLKIVRITKV